VLKNSQTFCGLLSLTQSGALILRLSLNRFLNLPDQLFHLFRLGLDRRPEFPLAFFDSRQVPGAGPYVCPAICSFSFAPK